MSEGGTQGLRGSVGVIGVVFLVVAAAAPLTAVGGALPVMIALGNGAGSPTAFLVAAAVLLVFSVGYAAMSRHMVDAGAFYAYVREGIGNTVGLGAAGLALLAYTAIQAAIYGLASATLHDLVVHYGGPDLPWFVYALGLIAVVALLGYRNIELGAKVLGVLLVVEIGIILVFSAAVLLRGGAHGVDAVSFTPSAFLGGSPGIALMFAIASFVGFEATAIYGEEARDPKRTVPLSTYAAVLVIGVVYAIASWAMVLAFGSGEVAGAAGADPSGLVFTAAERFLGTAAVEIMRVMLVTSLFAALLAFHNAISRYLYVLARDGHGHPALGRTHAKHGSPHRGSIAQTISAVLVVGAFAAAGADPVLQLFTWLSGLATVSVLSLMVLTSIAVIVFFHRSGLDRRVWHTRIAPALGTVGLLAVTATVLANFTTLVGGSTAAEVLLTLVVAVFVAGVLAARLRARPAPVGEPVPEPGI
ncbi:MULTISPECIES: APC family permease [Nocardia]|uniref:Putrescine importer PuuP n=1 Tax=Nocardia farcinica TaxID=37329 RepID=A0A449GXW6_NOCFR|nr:MULTISPECIES: APC family permease [Nocardia]MBF6184181.1 APC family permease [Nocardia farcinica]MBF6290712.1 APC family permease [Nocardia farcinica]MBF6310024.1 APC family permease [Nocardia farcinica]MBF6377885.1 APC family permease [Nocardia farcinica]MBF6406154.1 APC family permease [Nocardia farcinica]